MNQPRILKQKFTILCALLAVLLLSCVQSSDQTSYSVLYTVYANDASSGSTLPGATLVWTREDGSVIKDTADSSGCFRLRSYNSQLNQFSVFAPGYQPKDSVDNVSAPTDSTISLVLRVLRIQLQKIDSLPLHYFSYTILDSSSRVPILSAKVYISSPKWGETTLFSDSTGTVQLELRGSIGLQVLVQATGYSDKTIQDTTSSLSDQSIKTILLSHL